MKKLFLAALIIFASSNIFTQIEIVYPNVNGQGKTTLSYAILKLAMEKSGEEYKINIQDYRTNDVSQRRMLSEGKIDVADFGTSKEFEEEFTTVYFPIDLGTNGWRVLLIHKDNNQKFSKIKNLQTLQKYSTGLGSGWSDIKIFEESGIRVHKAPQISHLMGMLNSKRFAYFSLEAQNAYWHLEKYKEKYPNLVIEDTIVITYPFARFFFVRKYNFKLKDIIYKGLVKSFEDGSLIKLFKTHPSGKDLFHTSNMKNRVQIKIPNNHTSENFKKIPEKYFFNLSMVDN